jgi:RNA polymerase sigma-70 factor (ECF subfamily)
MESSIRPAPSNINPELLAQVTKGDQRAFEELYDQSSSILFTLAARILGNHDEAADLLQEVYLEVWRKAARYDPRRGSPMAWLVTLTRSRAIGPVTLAIRQIPGVGSRRDRRLYRSG